MTRASLTGEWPAQVKKSACKAGSVEPQSAVLTWHGLGPGENRFHGAACLSWPLFGISSLGTFSHLNMAEWARFRIAISKQNSPESRRLGRVVPETYVYFSRDH